ncbi:GTPase HflX [Candidatus Venteria ishoeyi]|uniref:ribosome rescue GTPase HflX n=1 Tax=Candidatus Venteria ishoeyi TaxID=1899563 RepID=UPI0025A5D795|nr:ribosome rescue GTPase HflX [Candidatus Venteria ishoeyi]MDM8545197.1 GTPase HflX [Candidatus Venteria ishoeyi]
MFERPHSGKQQGERAILVSIRFDNEDYSPDVEEFTELVAAAGVTPSIILTGKRRHPDPAYFVGGGKRLEIEAAVAQGEVDVILFNHSLSPAQSRNLERDLNCRVLDRSEVILDIFAQRARSFEGKLQVELAQLQHLSTRLIRGWTHLERQKGGIGLRGPGETQLETDRRLIGDRIKQIHRRLEKVRKQREQGRRSRQKAELPGISLVGYTNAGKSTLFNRLTEATVYAADQLFATLDPTLRRLDLPNKAPIILADTVGFIQQLPHDLVAAFRATLDETVQAKVLLHVVDASDPERLLRIEQVNEVLLDIGADKVPQILVYNKIDNLEQGKAALERDDEGRIRKVWLSAITGEGIDLLQQALIECVAVHRARHQIRIPLAHARIRARFHALGQVLSEEFNEQGDCLMEVEIEERHFAPFKDQVQEYKLSPEVTIDTAEHKFT